MKNLFRTLIALIAILSLACTALAEYKTPPPTMKSGRNTPPSKACRRMCPARPSLTSLPL